VEAYKPENRPFVAQIRRTSFALKEDALTSARQIREPVLNNDDIVDAFDGITYAKGGAVLSMLERYIGAEVFREGIRDHMKRFAHGSADVNDLVASLSKASGKDLAPATESFLFQNGVPMVNATIDCSNKTIELSQQRYSLPGTPVDKKREWKIPMCLKIGYENETKQECLLLESPTKSLPLIGDCPQWVLPNADFAGYYHWAMPPEQNSALLQAGKRLTEREWLSIADSANAAFRSGQITPEQLWPMIDALGASPYLNAQRSMMPLIRFMDEYLGDDPKTRWLMRNRAIEIYNSLQSERIFDAEFADTFRDGEERLHYSAASRPMLMKRNAAGTSTAA